MDTPPQTQHRPPKPLLIFDGDCSFCRFWVDYCKSATQQAVAYEPYQKAVSRFPEIPVERFRAAAQFVDPEGRVSSGAGAIFRTLSYAPEKRWLLWVYSHFSPFATVSETAYGWVARHRNGLYGLTRAFWGKHLEPARYVLTRSVFLRLLGVIYLIAFADWWVQIPGIIGSMGILPATELLQNAHSEFGARSYFLFPTLAWIHPTDRFISSLASLGVFLSFFVIADLLSGPALLLLWLLYLSQVVVGQEFLAYQWDGLLLEAGFLAIWLAPWPRRAPRRQPSPTAIWLLRWLLFREIFSSGMVKLLSGDPSWRNFTALTYHYETQPLPNMISWYMYQLPRWFQMGSAVFMYAIELCIPFLIFTTRRFRRIAAIGIALLQVLIVLTGNYSYFNLLTIVLCITLLDDGYTARLLPARLRKALAPRDGASERRASPVWRRVAMAALAIALVWSSTALMFARFEWHFPESGIQAIEALENFRVVSAYGLFAVMTKERDEIIVEGSDDAEHWKAYEFRYKPGDLSHVPPWVAPHQPRLDWQMWFAALGNYRQSPWFVSFVVRLAEGSPDVLRLLATNPFPDHPPLYMRAVRYRYDFTTFAERRATGNWWKRVELGEYLPPVSLR